MKEKALFLEKLNELLVLAKEQGSQITIEEVQHYFAEDALTQEQMELVFEYLLAQKIAVKGYLKVKTVSEKQFTEEEQQYLQEYTTDLQAFKVVTDEEMQPLYERAAAGDASAKKKLIEALMPEVVEIAEEMYQPRIFLGEMIQEGNLGLVLGVDALTQAEGAHEQIVMQIRQNIQLLIEEQAELQSRDRKMIEKVEMLDESIKTLTEELGRKVTIDELAVYMGVDMEEIEDILKLTGDEPGEPEEVE